MSDSGRQIGQCKHGWSSRELCLKCKDEEISVLKGRNAIMLEALKEIVEIARETVSRVTKHH